MQPPAHRYPFIDALRGFAIAGILFANIPDITRLGAAEPGPFTPVVLQDVLQYAVSARFVPIFEVLFGMSLAFMCDAARRRGHSPWAVLGRRLVALFAVGLLHGLLYPGEVLALYAAAGLLVMPVVILTGQRAQVGLGLVLSVTAYAVTGSGAATLPGMFILGAALVRTGWVEHLERPDKVAPVLASVSLVASVVGLMWQVLDHGDPRFDTSGGVAGAALALFYVSVLSLLWRTRARSFLDHLFTPLGRAAFTCYLTATLVVVPAGYALNLHGSNDLRPAFALTVAILVLQNLAARWWFTRFPYGPCEWIWRAITWWQIPSPTTVTKPDQERAHA